MKKLFLILIFLCLSLSANEREYIKFSNDMLENKTFYMEEDSGYESVMKFYTHNNQLKVFYVIDYHGKLDEIFTLNLSISEDGFIRFTIFDRAVELRLVKADDKEYIVQEYHNHAKEYKNLLTWKLEKPKDFMKKDCK
jgi:hypothetical protein